MKDQCLALLFEMKGSVALMASEVALCSFGTQLDSWHGEDDL